MSAFAVQAWMYRQAAELASTSLSRTGFCDVLHAASPHGADAWPSFRDLFLGTRRIQFENRDHCVIALLMMAAICEDEELEEEGQL